MMSEFRGGFHQALRHIASDRAAKSVLVGAIILYSFFYPAPYRSQVASHLPVAVVDLDLSPMSRSLGAASTRRTPSRASPEVIDSPNFWSS